MLVKDEGLNNCTSWILELSTILVQCRGPAALSAQHPSHDKDDHRTRQSRICFYSWAKVRQRSVVMAQRHQNSSLIPLEPIHEWSASYKCDPLRQQSLLPSVFHPTTGNALMTLNLQCLWWTKTGFVVPCAGQNPKKSCWGRNSTTVQIRKIFWQKCPPETLLPLLLILKHSIHQVLNYLLQLENLTFQWENKICYEAVCTWLRNKHQMTVDGDKILLSAGSLGLFTANFSFTYILQCTFL